MSASGRSGAPSFFVEFAGLPGCGKSTIVTALLSRPDFTLGALQGGGIHTSPSHSKFVAWIERAKPLRVLIFLITFASRHTSIAATLITYCLSCGAPLSTRFRYALVYVRLFIRFERAKKSGTFCGTILLDEAFVQAIASIGVPGSASPVSMTKLLKKTLPDRINAIVMLECNPDTLAARISARNSQASRFDRWPAAERKEHLEQLNTLLHKNIKAAEAIGVPVLRLSSEEPASISADIITNWLGTIKTGTPEQDQRYADGH